MLSAPPKTVLVSACCLFLSALVAVSYPKLPARDAVGATPLPTSCNATNAVCAGRTWETLVCDSSIKLTKCFDAKLTCHSWNVCDCCSAVPLHKCLSPLAGRAFGPDCSSPIDAREECCGDAFTHLRAFQGLADLQENVKGSVEAAQQAAADAAAQVAAVTAQTQEAASELVEGAQEKTSEALTSAKATVEGLPGSFMAGAVPTGAPLVPGTTCNATNAVCSARTWETLICDSSVKLSKCFDAKLTCSSWNVCDCCSEVPLYKCLSPIAGRAFDKDCSSPIDAREECCGDAFTHLRAFQAIADLQDNVKGGVEAAQQAASDLADEAQEKATEVITEAKAVF